MSLLKERLGIDVAGASRLGWEVDYVFSSDRKRTMAVIFPLHRRLEMSESEDGDASRVLKTVLADSSLLTAVDTWNLEGRARREVMLKHSPTTVEPWLSTELERMGVFRVTLPGVDLRLLGIDGFRTSLAQTGDVVVELRSEGDAIHVICFVSLQLSLEKGRNEAALAWQTPVTTVRDVVSWEAVYDFSPAVAWGRIGELQIAIDHQLTRNGADFEVPGEGPRPDGESLVWTSRNIDPRFKLDLSHGAPFALGPSNFVRTPFHQQLAEGHERGGAPQMSWTSAVASSSDPGFDHLFYEWADLEDLAWTLGPERAFDGADGTAWCAKESSATLTFTVPWPVHGFSIRTGRTNSWDRGPVCANREARLWDDEAQEVTGCATWVQRARRDPAYLELSGPRTSRATVVDGRADVWAPFGQASFLEPFPAGTYTLVAQHPEGACIADVRPIF